MGGEPPIIGLEKSLEHQASEKLMLRELFWAGRMTGEIKRGQNYLVQFICQKIVLTPFSPWNLT